MNENNGGRTSPEEFAKFILKNEVCENCLWCGLETVKNIAVCGNLLVPVLNLNGLEKTFGCNQWEELK